jgi:hypothetical protein
MKMRYFKEGGSEKHLPDITGIIKISGSEIDRSYIGNWAEKLDVADIWNLVVRRLNKPE